MLYFLPNESKTAVKKEYSRRVLVTGLFFLFLLVVVAVGLLLPSYFLSAEKERFALERSTMPQNTETEENVLESRREFQTLKTNLSILKPAPQSVVPSEVLTSVLSYLPSGVKLSGFTFTGGVDNKPGMLQIAGIARDRTVLVEYVKKIQADKHFQSADFPISNLAREKDIDFTIEAKGKF